MTTVVRATKQISSAVEAGAIGRVKDDLGWGIIVDFGRGAHDVLTTWNAVEKMPDDWIESLASDPNF